MGRVGLHWENVMWCFVTHFTIIQSVDGDGRTLIIIIIIIIIIINNNNNNNVVLFHTIRQQTAPKQQHPAVDNERLWVLSLTNIEIFLLFTSRHKFIHS